MPMSRAPPTSACALEGAPRRAASWPCSSWAGVPRRRRACVTLRSRMTRHKSALRARSTLPVSRLTRALANTGTDTVTDPVTCGGGEHNPACAPEKYCDFESGCGTEGICRTRPFCEPGGGPMVCGCDGHTHDSCIAMSAGIGRAHEGACLAPERQFECGDFTCDNGQLLPASGL